MISDVSKNKPHTSLSRMIVKWLKILQIIIFTMKLKFSILLRAGSCVEKYIKIK